MVATQAMEPAVVPQDGARPWGRATTVNDAIAGWMENGWQDLSPSTVRRYRSLVKTHIEEAIGKRPIASLSPYDVELFLRTLKAKGLSEESVRQVRAVLHGACRLARKWSGNVLPSPVADTELPDWSFEESAGPVRAPALAEVVRMIEAAAPRT